MKTDIYESFITGDSSLGTTVIKSYLSKTDDSVTLTVTMQQSVVSKSGHKPYTKMLQFGIAKVYVILCAENVHALQVQLF